MSVFGWCIPCRSDAPSTPDRRCAACGHVLIPPSWARRDTPYPWPERPDGWSWSPPAEVVPTARPEPVTAICAQCSTVLSYRPKGGTQTLYCGPRCKGRAATARKRGKVA